MKKTLFILLASILLSGCQEPAPAPPDAGGVMPVPLPVQQSRAYPETLTGRFVCLADFENNDSGPGYQQLAQFQIEAPAPDASYFRHAVNRTSTGIGALEVNLTPDSVMTFTIPDIRNFKPYTLLGMAVHSSSIRDDFQVSLESEGGSWQGPRALLRPGWNNVLIDIQRLANEPGFRIGHVRRMTIRLSEARSAVRLYIDDIMLIDNRRKLEPVPDGMSVEKIGLDYEISSAAWSESLRLAQGGDGLWRLNANHPVFQIAAEGESLPEAIDTESLEVMGDRRLGMVEVIENNPVRLRIANTWFFPVRAGEWVSMGVRSIRFEYTFLPAGQIIQNVEFNNAGGASINGLRINTSAPAVWSDGSTASMWRDEGFCSTIGRWCWQTAPEAQLLADFVDPGTIEMSMGGLGQYDHSLGCWILESQNGHCRFTFTPPATTSGIAFFQVKGRWSGDVSVQSQGRAARNIVRQGSDWVLFRLPVVPDKAVSVEVTGMVDDFAPSEEHDY
ncbi:MAG: hypothetical protein GXY38_10000 [Planctomycetes bacterium]|nr:hypothetical protein [Planctomycetota bacterium]